MQSDDGAAVLISPLTAGLNMKDWKMEAAEARVCKALGHLRKVQQVHPSHRRERGFATC